MAYPHEISSANFLPVIPFVGRVVHRSATVLYKVLYTTSGTDHLSMHKSIDAGVTWAEVDTAGNPGTSTTNFSFGQDDDGTRIWVYFVNAGGSGILKPFNTTTGTDGAWEADITGGPVPAAASGGSTINPNAHCGLAVLTNGSKVVTYSVSNATICELWTRVYASGSWGSAFETLVENFNESGFTVPYSLIGIVGDSSNRTHIYGWTPNGMAYVRINSDNSLSNYVRFGWDDSPGQYFGSRYGNFGEARMIQFGGVEYAALPHAIWSTIDGDSFMRPGLISMPASGTASAIRRDAIGEFMHVEAWSFGLSWMSVDVAYDSTTALVWLVWVKDSSTGVGYAPVIRASASKGFDWTASQAVFSAPSTSPIETMEATVSAGVLRAVFEASAGSGYNTPHYYQADITASPTACGGGSGNINAAR